MKYCKCILNIYYFHFFLSNISNGKNKINHELEAYTPGILLHPPLLYFNLPLISYFMFLTLQHVYFLGMGGALEN